MVHKTTSFVTTFIIVMFHVGYLISLTYMYLCLIVSLSLYLRIDVLICSAAQL